MWDFRAISSDAAEENGPVFYGGREDEKTFPEEVETQKPGNVPHGTDIFDLARSIAYRGYSRRRYRSAFGII